MGVVCVCGGVGAASAWPDRQVMDQLRAADRVVTEVRRRDTSPPPAAVTHRRDLSP